MDEIKRLQKLRACSGAIEYARTCTTWQSAWDNCERGDWMLWLLGKLSDGPKSQSRKKLVLAACKCARLSLKYVAKNEKRPLKAIQVAEKWANNEKGASLQDVRAAYAAAYAAADAAAAAYAAADAAAYAAADAADAAYAAAYAAADAAAARTKIQKKCADIVRKTYPKAPRL